MVENLILNELDVLQKIERMCLEIQEHYYLNNQDIYLIGIENMGFILAQKIKDNLTLKIKNKMILISFNIDKKNVEKNENTSIIIEHSKNASFLIIDDVINSGKTILYSIKKLIQNFPSEIKLLVLVERMYKNFPIKPDFIGTSLATTLENHIQVKLNNNQNFEVYLT